MKPSRLTLLRFGPIGAIVVIYVVAVGFMAWTITPPRAEDLSLHAIRKLPANTLLRDELVAPRRAALPFGYFQRLPDWQRKMKGKYLVEEVEKGMAISVGNVAEAPDLSTDATELFVVSLRDKPELARVLNAESVVGLSSDKGFLAPHAPVRAIVCDKPDAKGAAPCDAVVAVSQQELCALQSAVKIGVVVRRLP